MPLIWLLLLTAWVIPIGVLAVAVLASAHAERTAQRHSEQDRRSRLFFKQMIRLDMLRMKCEAEEQLARLAETAQPQDLDEF